MEEIQQNYSAGVNDSEATVVQPRFDALEAQTAQPVVPLTRGVAWRARRLPVALVLVSALVGGLVSVFAYRIYQRSSQARAAEQPAAVSQQATPELTPSPELTAAAPAKEESAPAEVSRNNAPPRADATTESVPDGGAKKEPRRVAATAVAPPAAPVVAPRAEVHTAASEPAEERRRAGGGDAARARREPPRAVRVDVITSPDATERVMRRHGDGEDGDGGHGRHGKGRNIDRIRDIFGTPPPG